MERAFFDLLLWENLKLHDSDFVFSLFAPIFRLHGLSGLEPLVLCIGLVFNSVLPKLFQSLQEILRQIHKVL